MSKLFTKFGKLQRTAEINSEGIGMGLMICQNLVQLNGGKITVHSEGEDKGSRFTFTMKMKQPKEDYPILIGETGSLAIASARGKSMDRYLPEVQVSLDVIEEQKEECKILTRNPISRAIQDDTEMLLTGSKIDHLSLPKVKEAPASSVVT